MFCVKCGKETPDQSIYCCHCGAIIAAPSALPARRGTNVLPWVLVGILAAALGILWYTSHTGQKSEPAKPPVRSTAPKQPRLVPVSEDLVSQTMTIGARQILDFRIIVTEKMRNARVVGRFSASGGAGNDIIVVLADEDAYVNWKNGHKANLLYGTDQVTRGTIDVTIPAPGIYFLSFSNAFSAFSVKTVSADIKLEYKQLMEEATP